MPRMGDEQAIAPNGHVVGYLNQVVDLGVLANDGVVEGTAIDTGSRPDGHPVLDQDSRPAGACRSIRPLFSALQIPPPR